MRYLWPSIFLGGCCLACLPGVGATPEEIAKSAGCTVCHAQDKKVLGPSFKEIAAKYKGDAAAPARLADHVRKGSKGIWGQASLKAVIAWILKS